MKIFNKKQIEFYPKNSFIKEIIPPPSPVTVPQWFKDVPLYRNGDKQLVVENGSANYTVKRCVPFLDSFSTGYTFNLWCDIQVRIINGVSILTWKSDPNSDVLNPVIERSEGHLPIEETFLPFTFSWISHWGIKTPKGYSCIFTHPFNRTDLPFITTTGIMDTDKWGIWGNQPFALKKDWEGVIVSGTPIIQVIPFKRENWTSSINENLTKWANIENTKRTSLFSGYYKKYFWSKKSYK